jgi:hypothetical protein
MSEIKNIVSNVLTEERKKRLDEAYLELNDIRDDVYLIERYISITTDLVNEGYDLNELDMPDSIKNSINVDAVKKGLSDSLMVSAKEYIFRFIANKIFGWGPSSSTIVAQLFADWNPLDLLKIFKNQQECIEKFPNLSDRLVTMMLRRVIGGDMGANANDYSIGVAQMGGVYLGNLMGEVVKETNLSEVLADKFCKAIH